MLLWLSFNLKSHAIWHYWMSCILGQSYTVVQSFWLVVTFSKLRKKREDDGNVSVGPVFSNGSNWSIFNWQISMIMATLTALKCAAAEIKMLLPLWGILISGMWPCGWHGTTKVVIPFHPSAIFRPTPFVFHLEKQNCSPFFLLWKHGIPEGFVGSINHCNSCTVITWTHCIRHALLKEKTGRWTYGSRDNMQCCEAQKCLHFLCNHSIWHSKNMMLDRWARRPCQQIWYVCMKHEPHSLRKQWKHCKCMTQPVRVWENEIIGLIYCSVFLHLTRKTNRRDSMIVRNSANTLGNHLLQKLIVKKLEGEKGLFWKSYHQFYFTIKVCLSAQQDPFNDRCWIIEFIPHSNDW